MLANHREFLTKISDADLAIYNRVLPVKSPLLDALEIIPWEDFRPELEKFYCVKLGQPAVGVILLLKIEYLQYLYQLSDRVVLERCNTDLLFRWFLQVPITYSLPDSSTLCRFRGRIGKAGVQGIFDRLISVARSKGLVKDRLRLKDATHVYSNIAVPTTLKLLAQLRQKMLDVIEPIDAEIAQGFQVQAERISTETEKEKEEDRLQARLSLVGDMLTWMLKQPEPSDENDRQKFWKRFLDVRTLAQKILDDCLNPGQGDRTLSVVDSDARRGMHGEFYDGYMIDLLMDADSQLITQIEVLAANGAEAEDAVNLIKSEQEAHGNTIDQISIDGIGFNGPMLRAMEEMNVDVITPPRDFNNRDGFPASAFERTPDGEHVTCPAGETSNKGFRDATKPNHTTFDFSAKKCWGCPLLSQCNPEMKETSRRGRRVKKNEYEEEYERARQKSKTKQYEKVRREHPAIERKLGEVARHGRGRRAKYWGRAKVKIQQLFTCFTVNVRRMIKLLGGEQCAQTAAIA